MIFKLNTSVKSHATEKIKKKEEKKNPESQLLNTSFINQSPNQWTHIYKYTYISDVCINI